MYYLNFVENFVLNFMTISNYTYPYKKIFFFVILSLKSVNRRLLVSLRIYYFDRLHESTEPKQLEPKTRLRINQTSLFLVALLRCCPLTRLLISNFLLNFDGICVCIFFADLLS